MGSEDTVQTTTIVGLRAENFKKISLVEVTPDGALVLVGGENEAGKSSVIDAVATVLGGAKLAPPVPVKRGQSKATVTATLGNGLKITRTFRFHDGETTSTLDITNADGSASFKSPQAMLDRLLGDAPFYDPLAFVNLRPSDRREEVRRLVGLDFSVLDGQRMKILGDRKIAANELRGLEVRMRVELPHKDAPAEEIDPDVVMAEIDAADRTVDAYEEAKRLRRAAAKRVTDNKLAIAAADESLERVLKALEEAKQRVADTRAETALVEKAYDEFVAEEAAAQAAVTDPEPIRKRMKDLKTTNERVQHNRRVAETAERAKKLEQDVVVLDGRVAVIDDEKRAQLTAAPFPVPGMSFSDDDVLIDELPFSQASTARKLRASVAMVLARAGEVRVLLVKAGNDLDTKNLGLLAELAQEHRAQIWVERVTDDPKSVTVFIEDGASR